MTPTNPIIMALDTPDIAQAMQLAESVRPYIGAIKLGLEFFAANGPEGVRRLQACDLPIFLDLKLHDIPQTVAKTIEALASLHVAMCTVHVSGGADMMKAAVQAAAQATDKGSASPLLLGVTVLTSMNAADLHATGVAATLHDHVALLAQLAQTSGLRGLVCSAHEVARLRQVCGKEMALVVPGIRPAHAATQDQKRTMTPQEALALGATHLVIGRPITTASDPVRAAADIAESIGLGKA